MAGFGCRPRLVEPAGEETLGALVEELDLQHREAIEGEEEW